MTANDPWSSFREGSGPEIAVTDDDGDIWVIRWGDIINKFVDPEEEGCTLRVRNGPDDTMDLEVEESLYEIYQQAGVEMPAALKRKLNAAEYEGSDGPDKLDRRRPILPASPTTTR